MKGFVLALLLGLVLGYAWGFGDAKAGKSSIAVRMLDKFGVSQVKDAGEARRREVESTTTP